jgi:hypothetical protein
LVQKFSQRVIRDLEINKPELMILPKEMPANHPITNWVSSGCWNLVKDNVYGYLILFARCGGELDSRLIKLNL